MVRIVDGNNVGICQHTLRLEMLPKVSEKGCRDGEDEGEHDGERKKTSVNFNNTLVSNLNTVENNTSSPQKCFTRVDLEI